MCHDEVALAASPTSLQVPFHRGINSSRTSPASLCWLDLNVLEGEVDRIDFASFGEGAEDGIEILVDKATVILH